MRSPSKLGEIVLQEIDRARCMARILLGIIGPERPRLLLHLGPLRLRKLHDLDASGLHLVDRRGVECRAAVEAIIAELRAMACAVLREGGITDDEIVLEVSADTRYAGQGFEIIVPLAPEALRDAVR
jgi:hypothetical protein